MFARVVLPLLALGLMIYALVDIAGTEKKDLGGLPKWFWVLIVILLPVLGPLLWIVTKVSRRRTASYGAGPAWGASGRPGRGARRPTGPVAPDDDPDFLWRLEQERRRQQRREPGGPADDTSTDDTSTDDTDGSPTDKGGPSAS